MPIRSDLGAEVSGGPRCAQMSPRRGSGAAACGVYRSRGENRSVAAAWVAAPSDTRAVSIGELVGSRWFSGSRGPTGFDGTHPELGRGRLVAGPRWLDREPQLRDIFHCRCRRTGRSQLRAWQASAAARREASFSSSSRSDLAWPWEPMLRTFPAMARASVASSPSGRVSAPQFGQRVRFMIDPLARLGTRSARSSPLVARRRASCQATFATR